MPNASSTAKAYCGLTTIAHAGKFADCIRNHDPKTASAKFWNRVYEPGWEPKA